VRTALCAIRSRITQQALVETMMLVLAGGASGVMAASWDLLQTFGPPDLPRLQGGPCQSAGMFAALAARAYRSWTVRIGGVIR
jgi:hypothetical protein